MIKYFSATKLLEYETKEIPQLNGNITEEIEIDSYNSGCQYFLEFSCPQGSKYISAIIEFDSANIGKITIPTMVFKAVGKVYVQLVVRDFNYNVTSKSLLSKQPYCYVKKSINASEKVPAEECFDLIASSLKAVKECKNTAAVILKDAKEGKFNGKDGTLIAVNGGLVDKLEFTANPQKQLNDLKAISMAPSKNMVANIFPNKKTENWSNYSAQGNGYIVIVIKVSNYGFFRLKTSENTIEYSINLEGNQEYSFLLPVRKGQHVECYFQTPENITKFSSSFVYSVEV